MIDWYRFSWEAFATILTGLGALIAALVIGLRQVEIQRTQTQIQLRQTKLAELALRKDLFEKRHAIYLATYHLLRAATRTTPKKEVDQIFHDFAVAKDQAKFLFHQGVAERLEEIFQKSSHVIMVRDSQGTAYRPTTEHLKLSDEYVEWMVRAEFHLSDIFGDELKLTEVC